MSELLIEGLVPELAEKARLHRSIAEHMGIDIVFTSGRRTWAEQIEAYGRGRQRSESGWIVVNPAEIVTFALPDQAPHCRGAAYDIVPVVAERLAWGRLDLFEELGKIGLGIGLVWGGSWRKLKDMPHFELKEWRSLPPPEDNLNVT